MLTQKIFNQLRREFEAADIDHLGGSSGENYPTRRARCGRDLRDKTIRRGSWYFLGYPLRRSMVRALTIRANAQDAVGVRIERVVLFVNDLHFRPWRDKPGRTIDLQQS